jgi:cell wall-associated NlpC family hydrolase
MDQESAIDEQLNLSQIRLDDIEKRMAVTTLEISKLQKRIGSKADAADTLAAELYKGGSSASLEAVLAAEDLDDIETRLEYLRSSHDAQTKMFERLAVDRQALNEKLDQLEKDKADASAEEAHFSSLSAEMHEKVDSQRDEIADLQAQVAAWERAQARAQAATTQTASAPAVPAAPVTVNVDPNSSAGVAVQTALAQVGKPYQWGAAGPSSFDCSGLTMYAWAHAGVSLPHSSAAQYSATTRVSTSALAPGDLLFYYSPIHHVAMYIGGGRMVEAPYTGATVRVVPLRTSDLVGAGRP